MVARTIVTALDDRDALALGHGFDQASLAKRLFTWRGRIGGRCFGMEISPLYVDVIVARFEARTGKKATVLHAD